MNLLPFTYLPPFFQFSQLAVLGQLGLLVFYSVCVVLILRGVKKDWVTVCIVFTTLVLSVLSIGSQADIVVFLLGTVFGYLSDALGVYVHKWSYPTKSGYSVWVGVGWGLVTLIMYQMRTAHTLLLVPLIVLAVLVLATQKSERPNNLFDWAFMFLKIGAFFIYPTIFVLSLTLGLIIEYLAVEIFHIWKYTRVSYLTIGLGYTLLVISVVAATEALFLGRVMNIPFILLLWVLYVVESVLAKK